MRQGRTSRYLLRPIAVVLFAVFLQACTKWTLVPEPKSLTTDPKSTVRLTLTGDAKHVIVKNPSVVGDIWFGPIRSAAVCPWIRSRGSRHARGTLWPRAFRPGGSHVRGGPVVAGGRRVALKIDTPGVAT